MANLLYPAYVDRLAIYSEWIACHHTNLSE
jgi:hypothetical protein